ncbi:nickel ABC transporter substrate-binding protein [Halalkalibacter urbisdiaboli]|uniref:nickel ABC transporter substrate-binding protein n=1 Tax=Halalkalibacter urbisdiaboli TaxID=1960589 RepID=UPI000B44785A|nr:nickel ABC transporter substrate-binding protein [Halalkalibacter urbisdiaboli]
MTRLLSILICILFISTACSTIEEADSNPKQESAHQDGIENEKEISLLFSFSPTSLDPHIESITVRAGITETLVKIDENLDIQPWLAESWEQIDDQTWVFKIRENITFHDGTALDGDAVKASFERAIDVSSAVQSLLKIESIEASGQEVTFKTTEPYPAFISELVHTSASVAQVNADDIENKPIGTGPFKVVSYSQDVEIEVERFAEYWDGPATISRAFFTFNSDANVRSLSLQSGDTEIAYHLSPEIVETLEETKDIRVESFPSLRVHFLLYNFQNAHLKDKNVRQALDALLNRRVIADQIMNGHATAANGPFNPSFSFGNKGTVPAFDPEYAKELLEDAGYKLNHEGKLEKDGETLSLKLATYQARPELPMIAQYLQGEASKIGIDIEIVNVENIDSFLYEQPEGWDLVTYSNLTAPRGDGGYFFNVAFLPDGSLNPGQIAISKLNGVIHELNQTSDQKKRIELQKQAVEIIQENVAHSYIVYPHVIVGINERVSNWIPGAEEYYMFTNTLDVN